MRKQLILIFLCSANLVLAELPGFTPEALARIEKQVVINRDTDEATTAILTQALPKIEASLKAIKDTYPTNPSAAESDPAYKDLMILRKYIIKYLADV